MPATPAPEVFFEIDYVNGKNTFTFKVDPYITGIYAAQSTEEKISERWPNLRYYFCPAVVKSEEYKRMLRSYNLFDDYGQPLVADESGDHPRLNIAWIRTVGGQGEIEITNKLGTTEATQLIKNLKDFLRDYFQDYFREYKISGSVKINI